MHGHVVVHPTPKPEEPTMKLRTTPSPPACWRCCSAAVLAQAGPAASGATPGVDQRQARQAQRIEQGKASGELNQREARRLERQQKGVARAEARAKADGTVTAQERKRLHRMQDGTSQRIHRAEARPPAQDAAQWPGTGANTSPGG
jgi:hypothetical protein